MQIAEPVAATVSHDTEGAPDLLREYAAAHAGSLFIDGYLTEEEHRKIVRYLCEMDRRSQKAP